MVDITSLTVSKINPFAYVSSGNLYGVMLSIFAIFFLLGMSYFVFFRKNKLKYHIQIYERENNGIPIPIEVDILEERQLNKGKNTMYWLRKNKAEAHPPTFKFIYKRKKALFGSELWCDYVREAKEFIPVQRQIALGLNSQMDLAAYSRELLKIYQTRPEEVRQRYVYNPIIPEGMPKLKFEPMDYNLNEMMQTKIAHREQLYADKKGWLQEYGPMVGIGLAAVTIIVIGYLGYNFATKNINEVIQAANALASKLGDLASKCNIIPKV